ncbi:hypothetical protein H4R23_005560, partial [Coemansia sp. Cherry 401B]
NSKHALHFRHRPARLRLLCGAAAGRARSVRRHSGRRGQDAVGSDRGRGRSGQPADQRPGPGRSL